jgi:hypothetical protein
MSPVRERGEREEIEAGVSWYKLVGFAMALLVPVVGAWTQINMRIATIEKAEINLEKALDKVEIVNEKQDTYNIATREMLMQNLNDIKDIVRDIQIQIGPK